MSICRIILQSNCVIYTGTHDNETIVGWYKDLPAKYKKECKGVSKYPFREKYTLGYDPPRIFFGCGYGRYSDAGFSGTRQFRPDEYPVHARWKLDLANAGGRFESG